MLAKHDVAVRMAALLLPGLLFGTEAGAQSGRDSSRSSSPSESAGPKVPQAPVGHRQPTAADIPKDLPKDEADAQREKRDRELDSKLRICRGC